MPIAFFTRTQTGALISRMNNDVIGAQRAVTQTLGQVVSNVVVLITTLIAMGLLEWRLTLISLILLPIFVIPAKRVGRRLQTITREGFDLNASMNTTMTERFNVSGALLVKLFGRQHDEYEDFSDRAGRVRDIGVRSAMYGRGLPHLAHARRGGRNGRRLPDRRASRRVRRDLPGHPDRPGRVRDPDLLTADQPLERPRRPHDRVRVLRPGVRGARRADRDHRPARGLRPDRSDGARRARQGLVPVSDRPGRRRSRRSRATPSSSCPTAAGRSVLRNVSAQIEPGQLVALVGPSGAGKTTVSQLIPRLYDVSEGAIRIDGHDVRDLTQCVIARSDRRGQPGPTPVPRVDRRRTSATRGPMPPTQTYGPRAAPPRSTTSSPTCPTGTTRSSASAGTACRAGRSSASLSPGCCSRTRRWSSSTKRRAVSTARTRRWCSPLWPTALAGRTAIVIAHRLSTITNADMILVMDQGEIVERGRHDELYAAGGLYADLYRTLVRGEAART